MADDRPAESPDDRDRLLIAVIIPCRNDAGFLARCLSALDSQTRSADRVIVVDNGSSDDSRRIAVDHGALVVDEPLVGIWPAAARGYDTALDGGFSVIARLDADSIPDPDWVERVADAFAAGDLDALTGAARFYGSTPLVHWLGRTCYIGGMYTFVTPWLGHPPLFGSNFAMTARLWRDTRERVARTRADIHDDLDLSIRLSPGTRIRYDRDLVMAVSARPFRSPRTLGMRVGKVVTTLAASWPEGTPWARRRAAQRGVIAPGGSSSAPASARSAGVTASERAERSE